MAIKFYYTKEFYGCFGNFSRHSVKIDNKQWPTTEHYFQAQKFAGTQYEEWVREASGPGEAAKRGRDRSKPLRKDWEEVKDDIMRKAVLEKMKQHPEVLEKLLSTGTEEIIEDSPVDYYWGCGKNRTGKNMLGKILMEIRNSYLKKSV